MRFGRKKSLKDRAQDYVEQLTDTVSTQLEHAWEQAVDKAGPALTDARDKAAPILADARDKATETAQVGAAVAAAKATEAREKAGPVLAARASEARDKAAPLLADARDKAAPILAEARATAADRASVGAALAAEKAAASRDLAAAKVNELRGVDPEPKGGRLKKVLLLGGLIALGGFVFSKLRGKQDESANWQSTYVPPAPPKPTTPTTPAPAAPVSPAAPASGSDPLTDPLPEPTVDDVVTAEPPATDDIGGGAPGEAISDSVEEAHPSTTPDDPAEVIDIDDVPKK